LQNEEKSQAAPCPVAGRPVGQAVPRGWPAAGQGTEAGKPGATGKGNIDKGLEN